MNILIQGAGALGTYFGGRMLEAGQNVSFFVRERRAAQLKKEGVKISSPEGNFERKDITIYTSLEKINNIDLVILAVKGYHLEQAIPQVQTIVKQTGAFVLPLLNGVEHLETLQEAIGKEKVIGGFASIIATLNEQGHVEHTSKSSIVKFGALDNDQTEICGQLEDIHGQVRTNILREENILKHMWKKYIFITSFSGITSAMRLPAGFIANTEASFSVAKKIIIGNDNARRKREYFFNETRSGIDDKQIKRFPKGSDLIYASGYEKRTSDRSRAFTRRSPAFSDQTPYQYSRH